MIIDCHTRIWASPDQLGSAAGDWLVRNGGQRNLPADPGDHAAAAKDVDKTLVWGFRSGHLGAEVPNAFLADYVARHRTRRRASPPLTRPTSTSWSAWATSPTGPSSRA